MAAIGAGAGIAFVDNLSAHAHGADDLALLPIPQAPAFAIYSVTNINRPP